MKIIRLPLQLLALLLQLYFFIETVRLHVCGYVMYMGEPIGTSWFSMLFTLLLVVVCEIISFVDAMLFVKTKKTKFSKLYLALIIINALCFTVMMYYTATGTIICLASYALLFAIRIRNLANNTADIIKRT